MNKKYWDVHYQCRVASENFFAANILDDEAASVSAQCHVRWGQEAFVKAAAALGYRLVAIEPKPVTSEPGFDNRHIPTSPAQTPPDGGRWNEHSTAQEA